MRQNMLAKADAGRFRSPRLLTLTVDRSRFDGPRHAHRHVTEHWYVARLMRLLGVRHWLWVLEFQTKSGDGWPHWHVLIDVADLPRRWFPLARAWHLWRDKWGIGGLDLGKFDRCRTASHAVMYLTKYLTKMPDAFPEWVLDSDKAVRFVAGSKAVGSLTGQPPRPAPPRRKPDPGEQLMLPLRQPRMVLLAAMARCEMVSAVFHLEGDYEAGAGAWTFAKRLHAAPADLVDLSESGVLSIRMAAVTWGAGELLAVTDASEGGVVAALNRLGDELAATGYCERWRNAVEDRALLAAAGHAGYWMQNRKISLATKLAD